MSDVEAQPDSGYPRLLAWRDLKPRTIALAVTLEDTSGQAKPKALASSSSSTERRPIFVDGVLMELPEVVILDNIRNGFFIVVYPGTNIPWRWDEDRHPFYPPPWFPDGPPPI